MCLDCVRVDDIKRMKDLCVCFSAKVQAFMVNTSPFDSKTHAVYAMQRECR